MDTGMRTYGDELVAVLSAATAVLSDLPARVHRLTGPDLDAVLPLVDRLAAVAAAGRFTITADAVDRGEVASSQAGSTAQWVADRCPSLDARDAGLVAKAVRELTDPSGTGQASAFASALAGARVAVQQGRLSVSASCVVASELRQLAPLLEPGAVDAVAAGLVAMGEVDGAAGVRRVRPAMLARYGLGERLAGAGGPAPGADRPVVWARHRRRDHRVPDAAQPRGPSRRRSRHQRPVRTRPWSTGNATPAPSTNAAATPSSRSAAAPSHGDPDAHLPTAPPGGAKATVMVTIGLDDLSTGPGPGSSSAVSTPAPSSARRPSGGWPATAPSSPSMLAPDGQLPALGTRPAVLHLRPDQSPLAPRPALHLPRLPRPRHLVRRPPPPALGRRRTHRPDQRRPAVRTAPHHRPPRPPPRHPHRHRGRRSSGTGPPAATTAPSPADPHPDQHREVVPLVPRGGGGGRSARHTLGP